MSSKIISPPAISPSNGNEFLLLCSNCISPWGEYPEVEISKRIGFKNPSASAESPSSSKIREYPKSSVAPSSIKNWPPDVTIIADDYSEAILVPSSSEVTSKSSVTIAPSMSSRVKSPDTSSTA